MSDLDQLTSYTTPFAKKTARNCGSFFAKTPYTLYPVPTWT
jgi:hypothetical protein